MSTWSLTGVDMTAGLAVTYAADRYVWTLVSSPRAALLLSVPLDDSGQAPGGL